ncbi:MAG: hypothetical protein ACOCYZ_00660 [Halococcoides sp.]
MDTDGTVESDEIARQLSARAASIERTQIEVATSKLDPEHHDVAVDLAERVTEQVLEGPLDALDAAAEREDTETVRTIATLFDIDVEVSESVEEMAAPTSVG